jgi:hypothetical protein
VTVLRAVSGKLKGLLIVAAAAGAGLAVRALRWNSAARQAGDARTNSLSDRAAATEPTRAELYEEAKRRGIRGRSKMTKAELEQALQTGG